MGAAKPTLGYSSRTEAVLALRAKGHDIHRIAAKIGVTAGTVAALEHSARRTHKRRDPAGQPSPHAFELEPDLLRALRTHAARRETSAARLARTIIETVLRDDIVDAVLDDGFRSEFQP